MSNIILENDQQEIYDAIISNIDYAKSHNDIYVGVIKGYAGVGKTTLVTQLVSRLSRGYKIAMTSPTHKANRVMTRMIDRITNGKPSSPIEVRTIHSFLGLKMGYEKSKKVLKVDPSRQKSLPRVDILIVDEASMVSDELLHYIHRQAHMQVNVAIIFVGDPCQLPPVEDTKEKAPYVSVISKSFEAGEVFELRTVRRQAEGSRITQLSVKIRECIGTTNDPMQYLYDAQECEEITKFSEYEEYLLSAIMKFQSDSLEELLDKIEDYRCITYTNNSVHETNMFIRSCLFPDVEDDLFVGEPIVVEESNEKCKLHVQTVIQCNSTLKRETFRDVPCWSMVVDNQTIMMLTPADIPAFEKRKADMIEAITFKKADSNGRYVSWAMFHNFIESFVLVNYPYANTIHKAQGSTYKELWMDTRYLNYVDNIDDKSRIAYTGITRPSDRLNLFGV